MACIAAMKTVMITAKATGDAPEPPRVKSVTGKVKVTTGKKYKNLQAAVDAGLVAGTLPFSKGIDAFGFFNDLEEREAQRYADVEITHGRVAMLAAVGFLVGEQVEGSSFLFDADITGPAINHFQQVPQAFWQALTAIIVVAEGSRVKLAWQNPFESERMFLLKDDYTPGDLGFDPLGLLKGKSVDEINEKKLKELNNGRIAMIAIAGMVGQELATGANSL